MKVATHGRFDEGLSDLPLDQLPPKVNSLPRLEDDERNLSNDTVDDITAHDLSFFNVIFQKILREINYLEQSTLILHYCFANRCALTTLGSAILP